jgi:hypothetical protein
MTSWIRLGRFANFLDRFDFLGTSVQGFLRAIGFPHRQVYGLTQWHAMQPTRTRPLKPTSIYCRGNTPSLCVGELVYVGELVQ